MGFVCITRNLTISLAIVADFWAYASSIRIIIGLASTTSRASSSHKAFCMADSVVVCVDSKILAFWFLSLLVEFAGV